MDAADRLRDGGRFQEAASRYQTSIRSAELAGDAYGRFSSTSSLAELYLTYPELESEERGVELWHETLRLAEEAHGVQHHNVGWASYQLAQAYDVLDRPGEAVPHYEGAVAVWETVHAPEHETTVAATRALASAQRRAGEPAAASALAERVHAEVASEDAVPLVQDEQGVVVASIRIDRSATYLQPNASDVDGVAAFVHVTEHDMPLLVAIALPQRGARDGSREVARRAAIEGMRMWEDALQAKLPWFELAFVEEDDDAPVQVVWKRRMLGDAAGRGGIRYRVEDGRLAVGGAMTITIMPSFPFPPPLTLEEVRLLVSHEFGHVLGLGHCFDCDSAMSYSWETQERVYVTELDVLTFRALTELPNGMRVDERLMEGVRAVHSGADGSDGATE